jgi:hypothetical protein
MTNKEKEVVMESTMSMNQKMMMIIASPLTPKIHPLRVCIVVLPPAVPYVVCIWPIPFPETSSKCLVLNRTMAVYVDIVVKPRS